MPPQILVTNELDGLNKIYKDHLINLRNKCNDYDGAHSYTRNVNVFFDKFIKLSILFLSSLTTYFIASHSDEIIESDLDTDKRLTLSTTLVSGINAIFNFSDKAENHKAIISEYLHLKNEINQYINTIDDNPEQIKIKYVEFFGRFASINDKTVSIGLMICAKRKHDIM